MANDKSRMQQYRGSDSARRALTPKAGEIVRTTDSGHLGGYTAIGDGTTAGGLPLGDNAGLGGPAGRWVSNTSTLLGASTAATSANVVLYVPIFLPEQVDLNIQNLGAEVKGAGTGATTMRLGLYRSEQGVPTDLIQDSGTLSVTSTGFKSIGSPPTTPVRPGWYFTAFTTDSATATFEVLNTLGYISVLPWSSSAVKRPTVHYQIRAYAALPATATSAGVTSGAYPIVHVQLA